MPYASALITGATSGIGEAFARALPPATDLVLTGRDRGRLDALAAELGGGERRIETLAADLSEAEGRTALIDFAAERPVDLLINNAGLAAFGALADNPPERESEMVLVNCLAPVSLTRALLPGMLARAGEQRRRAGLIFVASTAAFFPLPQLATYTATKAFGLALGESLASELSGQPVDVLSLCPGATRTNFFDRAGIVGMNPFGMTSAERVAREGLAQLGRRTVHVVGGGNRLAALASRFAPRSVLRSGTRRIATSKFAGG